MKKKLLFTGVLFILASVVWNISKEESNMKYSEFPKKKKTLEEKRLNAIEREKHEFNMQKNPITGEIPEDEKQLEYENSLSLKQLANSQRATSSTYVSRGPSNLGGRTRAFAVDISDNTSNIMLAGGVSSGLFRTTDGGASWTKVSPADEIHNVTALAQDTRAGFQNNWYYGTGEWSGNSASLGATYRGRGVWHSTDSGVTWTQIAATNSTYTSFDSFFDYVTALEVNPSTGDLFIATAGKVYRYDGTNMNVEVSLPQDFNGNDTTGWTDVIVNSAGRVYVSLQGQGVQTSPTGNGSWTQIANSGDPSGWSSSGRIVLAQAPSDNNIIYALYVNGQSGIQADLWQYNQGTNNWVNYSSKLPDEAGGDSSGNDPFAVQGGYDLVVSVKPDDENFVVIGGTNAYKIEDIVAESTFVRIGGYANNQGYGLYSGHHPDIHALEFDPNNSSVMYSGSDGGVHKTNDIGSVGVSWINLNNNYVTYQYYHVALDPKDGSNMVLGGAQDNGTTVGGTDATNWSLPDNTSMTSVAGGDGVSVGIARRNAGVDFQFYLGTQQGPIYRYTPTTGYALVTPDASSSQFVTYFYLDPDNNDNLYYAGNTALYSTDDSENITSSTWTNSGEIPDFQNIRTISTSRGAYDTATSYLLVGGSNGGIFRIDDPQNSTTFNNITPSGASTANGSIVSGLAVHPTNRDIVLAVYSNYGIDNIFVTTNATAASPTWTMVERNLSAHSIRSAAIAEVGSEIIYYVGTARGLYSSTDPTSNDWEMEGASNIGLSVISGLVYRTSDKKLLIGTHGNGMFETTVEGTLSTNNIKSNVFVSLYPNPTQNELSFESNTLNLNTNIKYKISDITGKTVQQGIIENKRVNVETLNSGTYIINLIVENKKQSLKFIKN